jgi:Putative Ig domain
MPLNVWTQASGHSFGSFPGEQSLLINLPVQNDASVAYTLISGALPDNVFLDSDHKKLYGTPFVLNNKLNYSFCIRASRGAEISDRTFTISVTETNIPTFITDAGALDIGLHKQFYVLDGTFVSYQLDAFDLNPSGEGLSYFIASSDGSLPPGLTLSNTGLIEGYINPKYTLTEPGASGAYDSAIFDAATYDFGITASDGFDDYKYDLVFFDYNVPTQQVISINVNYQFRVTITDGINTAQRVFRIFVVGNDEFRADSTTSNGLADSFTADATYIRQPVWITNPNLGLFRANNYLTLPLALYDTDNVNFRLETTNQEVYANTYQISQTDNIIGSHYLTITNVVGTPKVAQFVSFEYYLDKATEEKYQISHVQSLGNNSYRLTVYTALSVLVPNGVPFYIGSLSTLPPGTQFDVETGDVYGVVPYQPAITKQYKFTVTATRIGTKQDTVNSSRTFQLSIIGDVNSQINWISDTALGSVPADYVCTLDIRATSSVPNTTVVYELVSGNLPPGLTLNPDGEIIGMVNQFPVKNGNVLVKAGLITFDNGRMTFDNKTTTLDRSYTFTVKASDQFGYSSSNKEFTIIILTPNTVPFSNIITRPFLSLAQRALWKNFINNTGIFTPDSIYRTNDPEFGVQQALTMLVYAGIQTEDAAAYIGAMGLNHKRKRFQFGSVKKAVAIDPDTGDSVYEVVYIQMLDPQEPNGKHLPQSVRTRATAPETITVDDSNIIWSNKLEDKQADAPASVRPDYAITVDSTGYEAGNSKTNTYFPNSISNWRARIANTVDSYNLQGNPVTIAQSERNYLPLWMRSIPSGSKEQLDYTLAIPLCFCKVGTADKILLNIKFSGFDFKTLDYTVDRYIIDSVTGYTSDKYLVFRNDRITV